MKYLLLDKNGYFYDNMGNKIAIIKSLANTIDMYGFEIHQLTEFNNAIGKKLVALANQNKKPIKSVVSLNESFSQILILKQDFTQYNNLIFDDEYKIMISSNGVDWRSYISKNHYIENKYSLNIDSLNTDSLSYNEECELKKFKNDLVNISKKINSIECDGVKYIAFLLSPSNNLHNMSSNIHLYHAKKRITSINCIIDCINNTVSIKYIGNPNIKKIIINITSKDVIKNTLKEV